MPNCAEAMERYRAATAAAFTGKTLRNRHRGVGLRQGGEVLLKKSHQHSINNIQEIPK